MAESPAPGRRRSLGHRRLLPAPPPPQRAAIPPVPSRCPPSPAIPPSARPCSRRPGPTLTGPLHGAAGPRSAAAPRGRPRSFLLPPAGAAVKRSGPSSPEVSRGLGAFGGRAGFASAAGSAVRGGGGTGGCSSSGGGPGGGGRVRPRLSEAERSRLGEWSGARGRAGGAAGRSQEAAASLCVAAAGRQRRPAAQQLRHRWAPRRARGRRVPPPPPVTSRVPASRRGPGPGRGRPPPAVSLSLTGVPASPSARPAPPSRSRPRVGLAAVTAAAWRAGGRGPAAAQPLPGPPERARAMGAGPARCGRGRDTVLSGREGAGRSGARKGVFLCLLLRRPTLTLRKPGRGPPGGPFGETVLFASLFLVPVLIKRWICCASHSFANFVLL